MISYKFKLPQIKGVLQEGQGNGVVTEKVIGHLATLSFVIGVLCYFDMNVSTKQFERFNKAVTTDQTYL